MTDLLYALHVLLSVLAYCMAIWLVAKLVEHREED